MIPGEFFIAEGDLILNGGRSTVTLKVINTGDRPIQVGSHIHFFEINRALLFNRKEAFGMRLNIPAGTAVRFEAGEEKEVELVELGGAKKVIGVNNLTCASITEDSCVEAMNRVKSRNFKTL
ncbi:MAG: urease subunit beta [Rikenellaceae bacterium]